jgi:hypothetical protein
VFDCILIVIPLLINHSKRRSFIHDRCDKHVKALKLQVSENESVDEVTGFRSSYPRFSCRQGHVLSFSPTRSYRVCWLTSPLSRLLPAVSTMQEPGARDWPRFHIYSLHRFSLELYIHSCSTPVSCADKNRQRTLYIVVTFNVTCTFSRLCYVESFAWLKLPFGFLWNITALYMILMDLIYIFLHSSDSSIYLSVKQLVFTWLQYCSTPTENEALACWTQIQTSRSVIYSVFLVVFFFWLIKW